MLYANLSVNNSKDIDYITTDEIKVENKDFIDYVEITSKDSFINKNDSEINIQNGIVAKKLLIDEEQFDYILGEKGYIEIFDGTDTKIGILNKNSKKENGKYIFEFPSLISNIKYKLIKVQNNGALEVKIEKAISKNISLNKNEIFDIKSVKTENTNRAKKKFDDIDVAIQEIITQAEMRLEDTKTEISLDIDNNSLSSQNENEVSFSINLKTNSEEFETFKNPIIELVFPYSVQDVKIENINLLHKNGLSLENWGVEKNEIGENVLKIQLSGQQEEYNPSTIIEGTTINLVTKIIVNRLTTEEIGNIKLRYSNENSTRIAYEIAGKDSEEYEIKYVSNSELLTVINLDNFNNDFEVLSEINADRLVGKADVGGERKTSKASLNIINNFKQDMENVIILGKLPVVGNVDNNGNSLNTTIDANLSSEILTSGLISKIYYSEELNADINSDSWKENISDFSKIKCFKIEIANGVMHQGESINLSYNLSIPENLNYNENIFGLDTIYYKVGGIDNTKNIVLGLETEEKEVTMEDFENIQNVEKLKIGTKVTRGGEEILDNENVNERQILRYTTIVENISNETIKDISLKGNAHNANMYYWNTYTVISSTDGEETLTGEWIEDRTNEHQYDFIKIDSLAPGESHVFEYQVVVNDLTFLQDYNDKSVYGNIVINGEGLEEKTITTIKNPIVDAELEIRLEKNGLENANKMAIVSGEDYFIRVYIKNLTDTTLNNFEVNLTVPSFIKYNPLMVFAHDEYNVSVKETSKSNIITLFVDEMEPGKEEFLFFYTKVSILDINTLSLNSTVVADTTINGRKYISNDYSRVIYQDKTSYEVDFYGNKEDGSIVQDGEELEYTFIAKNIGVLKENVLFEYFFQLGLDINSIDLFRDDGLKENLYTKMEENEQFAEEIEENNEASNDSEENQENQTYIADIYENLTPEQINNFGGYIKESNLYKKRFDINPKESIKIIIKAKVDLSKGITDQKAIVSDVSFKGAPIEKTVTYYLEKPEEEKQEEEKIIEEYEPYSEVVDNQNIISEEPVEDEEGLIKEDVIIDESDKTLDVDENPIITDEKIENEQNNYEEINNNSSINDFDNNIIDRNENKNSNEKAVILESTQKPILSSPSKSVNSNSIENISDPNSDNYEETHSISGTVWLDDNKDGIPDKNENKIANLKVQLFTEDGNNAIKTTTTDKIGEYSFKDVSKGNYIVIFSYDNELYNINSYSDENIENTNLISNRTINGKKYGISDTIVLNDSDITDLNMALKSNDKFDLEIKSYISKIRIRSSKGIEEYKYDENDLPKVEIASKNIEGAEVTATFNIIVKNTGNVPGYATSIKNDTIGGWTFNEAQNRNWIVGEDGSLYCLILKDIEIEPGKSNEIKLVLSKTMTGNDTGVFTNTSKINGTTNNYQLKDEIIDNDEVNSELIISIKTGIKTYIIIGITALLIFIILISVINIILLKKVDKNGKRKINIIIVLLFILLMISIYAIKSQAVDHIYPNTFNGGEVGETLYKWCIGGDTAESDLTISSTYNRVDDYLKDFYGAASTRQAFLGYMWRFTQDNDSIVRTGVCMHASDITPAGVNPGRTAFQNINTSDYQGKLKAYAVVDSGHDNNSKYNYYNTMYGDYASGLFTSGSPNQVDSLSTYYAAQTLSYIGWASDQEKWNSQGGSIYQLYKDAISYTALMFPSFNDSLEAVSGVKNVVTDSPVFNNFGYVETFANNIKDFNEKNATVFEINKKDINKSNITIKDVNGSDTVNIEKINNSNYITGIKVKFPISGQNANINNRVFIYYSNDEGTNWTKYTGKFYVQSGSNVSEKTQNSDYGLNTTSETNNALNKNICLPSNICTDASKFRIKIVNSYYAYRSRTIFMIKLGFDQCQGVFRGKRFEVNTSVIYKLGISNLEIKKDVYKIDDDDVDISKQLYAETGSEIIYKVTLKNTGDTILKNITFTDEEHYGQTYKKCSHRLNYVSTSDNGKTFKYSSTLDPDEQTYIYLYYTVNRPIDKESTEIRNVAEVTDIESVNGAVVYSKDRNINKLQDSSKLKDGSQKIKLRIYKPVVNKYIYSNDSVVIPDTRKDNKSEILYTEYGGEVVFLIHIKNNGDNSGIYGDINGIEIEDTYNNTQLEYMGAHALGNSTYIKSGVSNSDKGDWEIINDSSNSRLVFKFLDSNRIAPGGSAKIYVKFKNKVASSNSSIVTNTARISSVENRFGYTIEESKAASGKVYSSSDSFNSKTYNADIEKKVWITSEWVDSREAEVGDNINYLIKVTNNGSGDAAGNVKNIVINDSLLENTRNDNKNYFKFIGYRGNSNNGAFVEYGISNGWEVSDVTNSGIKLKYNNTIKPGENAYICLKFNIEHGDTVSKIIKNDAERIEVKNIKNLSVQSFATGTKKDSAEVKIKTYSANVLKYIYSVSNSIITPDRSIDKSREVTIENGDTVVYKIVVKNDGTNANDYGNIHNFELVDTYPSQVFAYTSDQNYGTGWSKSGEIFKFNGNLGVGESTTLTLKFKVVDIDDSVERDENGDAIIENVASLENQIVRNKNGININSDPNKILNGRLTDGDFSTLLITRLDISKYIIKNTTADVAYDDRDSKSNSEKFDNPVEVEKRNLIIYRIDVKNVGRASIHSMKLKDILDDELAFSTGFLYSATLIKEDNSQNSVYSKVSGSNNGQVKNIIYEEIFSSNQTLRLEFYCKVNKTNLYLQNLKNCLELVSIKNKNNIELTNTRFLELKRFDNEEYVRLKNLPITGTVWLDENLNGLIDEGERKLPGVKVALFDDTNGKKTTVTTDNDGKYIFIETNGESFREGATSLDKKMVESDGRVIKGTNRNDTTGNYDNTSQHINYYIAFEYDGGKYETIPLSVYANDDNVSDSDNSINETYKIDSNATEDNLLREEFNNRLENISYNLATSSTGTSRVLEYDKNGHESIIDIQNDTAASMFAYSFMKEDKTAKDGIQDGDLRYLWFKDGSGKYDGETEYLKFINVGLSERKFDLKIEQDVYSIKNTINGQEMTYNFNQRDVSSEYGGEYILGGEREDYSSNPYQFRLYNSDYYYNSDMYSNEDVKNYKENTELNTEITFRVKVTNEDVDDNKEVYAEIKEIADYYSNNFMKVNTSKTIKKLDNEGYLEDINPALNAVEAWIEDGENRIDLSVSANNQYGEAKNFDSENYSALYITGFKDSSSNYIKINEGESLEFFIKFIVDKDETEKIIIGSENNIVELNAYSTYKKTGEPAGYIDRDSNPGNVMIIDRVNEYEDDNYRTGIDIILGTKERSLSGFVWDDARTESTTGTGIQYYGDGKYDTSVVKNNSANENGKISNVLHESRGRTGNTENEGIDFPVKDARASIVEVIKMKDNDGNTRYYEESINPWLEGGVTSSLTNENGEYGLSSFIPGKYETHFEYGYAVGENVSQNMQVFNGHDYKSTKYNTDLDSKVQEDDILTELKKANVSDARDDEIRRLEVISYSEKMTNEKAENIQRASTSNISEKEFAEETAMLARTKEYKIKPEDVAENVNTYPFNTYLSLINGDVERYKVDNIDFGIEFRPETSLLLKKYISNLNVKLSTGEDLVNISYNNIYEDSKDSVIINTIIDKDNSIGEENLQELRTNIATNTKGFEYLNVDTDLLQGATVRIEYLIVASNESEVDRINKNLDDLKYIKDVNASYTSYIENEYSASGTAKNQLIDEYYANYGTNNKYRIKVFDSYSGSNGYFGKYLGNMYYTGAINESTDIIAKLQIDKILDYVDTDISFSESENNTDNNYWKKVNETTLFNDGYLSSGISRPLTDNNGIRFSINDNNEDEMSNLVVSINDRTSISDASVKNKSLSKYLVPSSVSNKENFGYIKLMTSKVLATETDTDNMKYDNTSEIIQYTSQTGRATQMKANAALGQTVGNVDPKKPTPTNEPDSSFTETITLSPPTGLDKLNYYTSVYMSYALIILTIILVSLSGTIAGIKIKNHKKFYK